MSIALLIEQVLDRQDLTQNQSLQLMQQILNGQVAPAQTAAFLSALRAKPEAESEIVGFARAMRQAMVSLETPFPLVADTCGTGGDGKNSFNISTAAALVVAGAGVPVAKHGNRSVSSQCGSADVLQACGVKLEMDLQTAKHCLVDVGITFLFAPLYHPALKVVSGLRKEMGIRTVFNLLGPLCNPAHAKAQIIGVNDKKWVPIIARVLAILNQDTLACNVVLSDQGHDEWILSKSAVMAEVFEGQVHAKKLSPKQVGLESLDRAAPGGKNAKENAELLINLLDGKQTVLRPIVLANAALSIYSFKKASLQKAALKECYALAEESLLSGKAKQKLQGLVKCSHR